MEALQLDVQEGSLDFSQYTGHSSFCSQEIQCKLIKILI